MSEANLVAKEKWSLELILFVYLFVCLFVLSTWDTYWKFKWIKQNKVFTLLSSFNPYFLFVFSIDECFDEVHECDSLAKCHNTPGNYSCQCPDGYFSQWKDCIGEANNIRQLKKTMWSETISTWNYFAKLNIYRNNRKVTKFRYRPLAINSRCPASLYWNWQLFNNSVYILDVDECAKSEVHQCEQVCNNTPGRLVGLLLLIIPHAGELKVIFFYWWYMQYKILNIRLIQSVTIFTPDRCICNLELG